MESKRTIGPIARRVPFYRAKEYLSPEFAIRELATTDGRKLNLIDESHLFGGSKQRALIGMLTNYKQNEIVYAGPASGYAQVALAYCCRFIGKKAKIFTDARAGEERPLVRIAQQMGANVVFYSGPDGKRLAAIQSAANNYVNRQRNQSALLPFGLKDKEAMALYASAFAPLKIAVGRDPTRIWTVAGSAMIASTLAATFPMSKLMIVQVGRTIWPDELTGINHELFVSPYYFTDDVKQEEAPPYNTLLNYDAKLWPFVLEFGQSGDYVWNTAGAPKSATEVAAEIAKVDAMLDDAAKEYESMLPGLSAMALPMFSDTMPEPTEMFEALKAEARTLSRVTTCRRQGDESRPSFCVQRNFTQDYGRIDGISNHFTEKERMRCIVNKGEPMDMYAAWTKRQQAILAEALFMRPMGDGPLPWRDAMAAAGCHECNTFNPLIVCAAIARYFDKTPIRMLDPSAGWGDRLIGALASNVSLYVGFDPNIDLHPCYSAIVTKLAPEAKAHFIADKFAISRLPVDMMGSFDLVLTSPPFYDQEVYRHTETDARVSYAQWLAQMYEPYLRDMVAGCRPGGYVAVYIENVPRIAPMADDTNRILKANGLEFIEIIYFRNDHTKINGIVHPGHPKTLWVHKKRIDGVDGGGPIVTSDTLNEEWARLRLTRDIIAEITATAKSVSPRTDSAYEAQNVAERLVLSLANRAAKSQPKAKDPLYNWPVDWSAYRADFKYKFPLIAERKMNAHVDRMDSLIRNWTSATGPRPDAPDWRIVGGVFTIGDYTRTIAPARMKLLVDRAGKEATARMLIRYGAIISGPSHWEAPIEYFRVLYAMGCRFEGFSSPINSNFILLEFKETRICTLFPDTDSPWGSIGGFFNTDFLMYDDPVVVVGPPYFDELILNIARHLIDHCARAVATGKKIRFIVTHSNSWDYSEGFRLLKTSEYLRLDHVFKRGEHYYNNDKGERIVARFETRLFVLDAGMPALTAAEARSLKTKLLPRP